MPPTPNRRRLKKNKSHYKEIPMIHLGGTSSLCALAIALLNVTACAAAPGGHPPDRDGPPGHGPAAGHRPMGDPTVLTGKVESFNRNPRGDIDSLMITATDIKHVQ